jgi:branched-chain amino acid transport system substrate-binding protein
LKDAIAATKDFMGVTGTFTLDAQRNASKPAVILSISGGGFHFEQSVAP